MVILLRGAAKHNARLWSTHPRASSPASRAYTAPLILVRFAPLEPPPPILAGVETTSRHRLLAHRPVVARYPRSRRRYQLSRQRRANQGLSLSMGTLAGWRGGGPRSGEGCACSVGLGRAEGDGAAIGDGGSMATARV